MKTEKPKALPRSRDEKHFTALMKSLNFERFLRDLDAKELQVEMNEMFRALIT
jgi:hypothetical protein